MPIRIERHITRAMLKAEPRTLWVFGDNIRRVGLGGQAAEMRGEPNAVGIPTKHAPGRAPLDYFTNGDLDLFRRASEPDFERLLAHLLAGGTVVLPGAGIGTGLADLERRAPRVWACLQYRLKHLEEIHAALPK